MPEDNRPPAQDGAEKPKRDFRQEVTDNIVRLLETNLAPWQKPWDPSQATGNVPLNPTTDKQYRGGNAVHLMAVGLQRGYADPRWMTYKQAADNGWQVRKGERGTPIEYWEVKRGAPEPVKGGKEGTGTGKEDVPGSATGTAPARLIHRVYTVFNAQQIEGVPAYQPKARASFEVVEAGESILKNSGARIAHDQVDRAFYRPSTDSIHLPEQAAFKSAEGYLGTALHELAHWSGHTSRLDRKTLNETYRFGDTNYAKEELRAELASMFIAAETGIPHNPESHAAYIGSWIRALKDDKNEIFRAAHDASAAADFITALDKTKERSTSPQPARPEAGTALETVDQTVRLNPDAATVQVEDKRSGDQRRSPVNGVKGTDRTSDAVKEFAAQTKSGLYRGPIIADTETDVVQRVSDRSTVRHLKDNLDTSPNTGESVSIAYSDGKGVVRPARERSRAVEKGR